jgi:hypothetical protein
MTLQITIPTFALLLTLFAVDGCKSPTLDFPTSQVKQSASTPNTKWPPEPARMGLSLVEQLQYESDSRPTKTIRSETVFSALSSKRIPIQKITQVLAHPIGARFCMSGMTDLGLTVVACEFSSDDEAQQGKAYSENTFGKIIPNRRLLVNQKTLLTLTPANQDAQLAAQASMTTQIFQTL